MDELLDASSWLDVLTFAYIEEVSGMFFDIQRAPCVRVGHTKSPDFVP